MSDLLKNALETILADEDIRTALLDYLRAATTAIESPASEPEWREVWHQESADTRMSQNAAVKIMSVHDGEARLYVKALYCEDEHVGKLAAEVRGVTGNTWTTGPVSYTILEEAFMASDYTSVITRAQDWWDTAYNTWVEKWVVKEVPVESNGVG
jgi:hypothetical protein